MRFYGCGKPVLTAVLAILLYILPAPARALVEEPAAALADNSVAGELNAILQSLWLLSSHTNPPTSIN